MRPESMPAHLLFRLWRVRGVVDLVAEQIAIRRHIVEGGAGDNHGKFVMVIQLPD